MQSTIGKISAVILLAILLLTVPASCSTGEGKEAVTTEGEAKGSLSPEDGRLAPISREEAGLRSIPASDFRRFALNERIEELLGNSPYKPEDYKRGLGLESCILVTERFEEPILDTIRIGTEMDTVGKILGEPGFRTDNTLFYKSSDYYFAFRGKDRVELAAVQNRPVGYTRDILRDILKALDNPDDSDLSSILEKNPLIAEFFEAQGHIHGGGWYANADNGVVLEQFDVDTVTVYNNFEGSLYRYKNTDSGYQIVFQDRDYIGEQLENSLNGYLHTNGLFDGEGTVSPSGKMKCIYEWFYSMSHYFTIRTLDCSVPDYRIHVMSQDFRWLDDRYLLYLHTFSSIPYVVEVKEEPEFHVSVLQELDLLPDGAEESFGDYEFEITDVKDGEMVLTDKKSSRVYKVRYSIDNQGKIAFRR